MNCTGTFFNDVIHLLYPELCAGCGSDLIDAKVLICPDCIADMPVTGFEKTAINPIEKIFRGRIPVLFAYSHVYFTKKSLVQNLLHRLKYKGHKEVGRLMGRMMGETLKTTEPLNDLNAIIPLPLHRTRERKRGYNQSALIAAGIGEALNVPVFTDIVLRKKQTDTQTHKSRMERWHNIESKFEVRHHSRLHGKHVLLVDDVLTTGATLESCGMELLKADDTKLSIATFAYTTL